MTTNNRMSKMSKMVSEKKNLIIVILIVSVLVAAYVILNYYGKNVEGFETGDMDFILDGQEFSIDKHLVSSSEVPIGTIVAWGASEIPKGWAKCDGKVYNGIQTPDLSGKFIFG